MSTSKGLLADVLANLKSGLLVVDEAGKVVFLNHAGQKILHLSPIPPEGRDCSELLSDYPYLAELILASFKRTTLPDRAELEIRAGKDKAKKVIGYTISPVVSGKGKILGVAFFFKDLTSVEREESKTILLDRLATMGKMAAWMAHEIRNPLAAIGVNAGLLARDEKDHQRLDLSREILYEVKRLNGIITQTLDFVRQRPLNLQESDLHALLRDVVEQSVPEGSGIKVNWSLGKVGKALLDETQLRNAFQNLIKNSCEAMASETSGGELRIRTYLAANEAGGQVPETFSAQVARGDRNLMVEIEDTGPGMPKEVLDKVFTPFFTTKPGGTGLGMSIAHKSITDHWGFLDIESLPGKGTRFIVTLPYYRHAREGEEKGG